MEFLHKEYRERDNKTFKVELIYDLGGMNYYSIKPKARGYYISITPVRLEDTGHFTIETSVAWTGIKECILEVNRKSDRAYKQALSTMTDTFINGYIDYVIRINKRAA